MPDLSSFAIAQIFERQQKKALTADCSAMRAFY